MNRHSHIALWVKSAFCCHGSEVHFRFTYRDRCSYGIAPVLHETQALHPAAVRFSCELQRPSTQTAVGGISASSAVPTECFFSHSAEAGGAPGKGRQLSSHSLAELRTMVLDARDAARKSSKAAAMSIVSNNNAAA